MERSAELWSREAFSDATHCGEICAIHFPVGTENCKNRELLPIDNRPDADVSACYGFWHYSCFRDSEISKKTKILTSKVLSWIACFVMPKVS